MRALWLLAVVSCATAPTRLAARVECSAAVTVGVVPMALVELSGLVSSRAHPGVLYAHNDSGDSARFFAMSSTDAQLTASYTLPGASAVDWEDIALGPCGGSGKTCVFLGDVGDNKRVRDGYAVYRVEEPASSTQSGEVQFERFAFEYPGGVKKNAEALVVHPSTGRVYVLTKEETGQPSEVYRFPEPMNAAGTATLVRVGALSVPLPSDQKLTAASVDPTGRRLLLRMYNRLVELELPRGVDDFEQIFAQVPVDRPFADEPQGEAVAFSADGQSYFTSSERPTRAEAILSRFDCRWLTR